MDLEGLRCRIDKVFEQGVKELEHESLIINRKLATIPKRNSWFSKHGGRLGKIISDMGEVGLLDLQAKEKEAGKALAEVITLRENLSSIENLYILIPILESMYQDNLSQARESHLPIPGQPWCHDSELIRELNALIQEIKAYYSGGNSIIPAFG